MSELTIAFLAGFGLGVGFCIIGSLLVASGTDPKKLRDALSADLEAAEREPRHE